MEQRPWRLVQQRVEARGRGRSLGAQWVPVRTSGFGHCPCTGLSLEGLSWGVSRLDLGKKAHFMEEGCGDRVKAGPRGVLLPQGKAS